VSGLKPSDELPAVRSARAGRFRNLLLGQTGSRTELSQKREQAGDDCLAGSVLLRHRQSLL